MTTPVFIDLETQSTADLKAAGSARYASDPTTRIGTAVALRDGDMVVWVPRAVWGKTPCNLTADDVWPEGWPRVSGFRVVVSDSPPPTLLTWAANPSAPFVAHNANAFDALVWERFAPAPAGGWFDTLLAARAGGYPGALERLSQMLLGRGKDEAGRLLKRFCEGKVAQSGRVRYCEGEPGTLHLILRYNIADVLLLEQIYAKVQSYGEADVIAADRAINNRGVRLDVDLAKLLLTASGEAAEEATREITHLTRGAIHRGNVRSRNQVLAWAWEQGAALPDLRKKTVDRFGEEHQDDFDALMDGLDGEDVPAANLGTVARVLKLKQTVGRITAKKLERALASVSPDGRLRHLLAYYAAHTGRWAGKGFQPHNLTKSVIKKINTPGMLSARSLDPMKAEAARHGAPLDDVVAALLRPCFRADDGMVLLPIDFAAIEARGVAWCAGEAGLLDLFASGGDPYCDLASKIFGRTITKADAERQVGKIGILGAGYGMSGAKMGANCVADGIDLESVGVTAEQIVDTYRDSYPAIAGRVVDVREKDGRVFKVRRGGLWQSLDLACKRAVEWGKEASVGNCRIYRDGSTLVIELPSGRPIYYRNARVEDRVPGYCEMLGLPPVMKPTLLYGGPRGTRNLYGGKICENLIQAICRDLLATAIVRMEAEGLPSVLHVHDEAVPEVPRGEMESALRRACEIMSTPPPWAAGFPIKVEGFAGEHYTKGPLPGWPECVAENGCVVKYG